MLLCLQVFLGLQTVLWGGGGGGKHSIIKPDTALLSYKDSQAAADGVSKKMWCKILGCVVCAQDRVTLTFLHSLAHSLAGCKPTGRQGQPGAGWAMT